MQLNNEESKRGQHSPRTAQQAEKFALFWEEPTNRRWISWGTENYKCVFLANTISGKKSRKNDERKLTEVAGFLESRRTILNF